MEMRNGLRHGGAGARDRASKRAGELDMINTSTLLWRYETGRAGSVLSHVLEQLRSTIGVGPDPLRPPQPAATAFCCSFARRDSCSSCELLLHLGTRARPTFHRPRPNLPPPQPSPNMPLVDVVQVADALVPRVLTLSSDMLLSDAMRAFRLTRNEFAIVVGPSGFDTAREGSDAREGEGSSETPADGEDVAAGGTSLKAQTLLAEVGRGKGGGGHT